jgi:hypothetical protein
LSRDLLWQWRPRCLSTLSTDHVRKLIFGDLRLHRRHFGHLMPSRFPGCGRLARLLRQIPATVPALLRQQHLDGAHLGGGAVSVRPPIRRKKAAWRNWSSSSFASPVAAPNPQSLFRVAQFAFPASAICFSRSATCFSRSATLRRSSSFSRCNRSFSRCSRSRLG